MEKHNLRSKDHGEERVSQHKLVYYECGGVDHVTLNAEQKVRMVTEDVAEFRVKMEKKQYMPRIMEATVRTSLTNSAFTCGKDHTIPTFQPKVESSKMLKQYLSTAMAANICPLP
ncbi:hypothetical protein BaRGS_00030352 [Batillaria attramentaria]|uniref:Uncharacterized protein n=1 Tax=Batillaria attramentaria TaxID=370345 RepID=A0ABD0JUV3_9CAEN